MKRGKTEAETLRLNGWGVGDLLEGREGNRVSRILITHIGEERFGCKWDYHCNGNFTEERFNTTLSCRDWYKVSSDPSGRELNPTTSSLTDSQARDLAREFKTCGDGTLCGAPYCEDCPNQPTPEEDEAFNAMSEEQEKPHEADARMLDAQLMADMVRCGCGDMYHKSSYGAGFIDANNGVCQNCDAPEQDTASQHYRHSYKGVKLDPYRIAKIYDMQGGPREQIMKKCLRFTDKGQTEQQVVNEIRSALYRWQQMINEDEQK